MKDPVGFHDPFDILQQQIMDAQPLRQVGMGKTQKSLATDYVEKILYSKIKLS